MVKVALSLFRYLLIGILNINAVIGCKYITASKIESTDTPIYRQINRNYDQAKIDVNETIDQFEDDLKFVSKSTDSYSLLYFRRAINSVIDDFKMNNKPLPVFMTYNTKYGQFIESFLDRKSDFFPSLSSSDLGSAKEIIDSEIEKIKNRWYNDKPIIALALPPNSIFLELKNVKIISNIFEFSVLGKRKYFREINHKASRYLYRF